MTATMNAVRVHQYGGPEVLQYEVAARPEPAPGEALVRVEATTVNPFDCALRAGYLASFMPLPFPFIVGTDVAGVIEEVGADVTEFKRGDRVFGRGGITRDGANAEFVTLPVSALAPIPPSLDAVHAAALPHVALTAFQALFELGQLQSGQTILIHGAAGGVGHIATQLAKARGAHVIGTTSQHGEFVRGLAADQVIDYTAEPFDEAAHDVDMVLDTVGGDTQARSWRVLKPDGVLVSVIQAPSADVAASHGVRQAFVFSAPPIRQTLDEVSALVEAGRLKVEVSLVLPLSEIREAHQLVEGKHTRGKIVLQVM